MKHRRREKNNLKRLLVLAALIIVGFFFPRLAAQSPELVEKLFTQGLYVWISTALAAINSILPFSLTEIVIFALLIAVFVLLILGCVRLISRRSSLTGALNVFLSIALTLGILLNAFYFMWGLNYYRPQISALMKLDVHERSVDELYSLCKRLTDDANALRKNVSVNTDGIFELSIDMQDCFSMVKDAYSVLGEQAPLLARPIYLAKPVHSSKIMSYAGIAGLYMPFFAEANINVDQPDIAIPYAAAHESAHYLGFAREDEANFLAYIVCSASDDIDIRYSGTINALIYCANALKRSDPERYAMLTPEFSEGLRADIVDFSKYWDKFEGIVMDTVNSVNDGYLKFNEQEAGVLSYGNMVDLMLAYFDE